MKVLICSILFFILSVGCVGYAHYDIKKAKDLKVEINVLIQEYEELADTSTILFNQNNALAKNQTMIAMELDRTKANQMQIVEAVGALLSRDKVRWD